MKIDCFKFSWSVVCPCPGSLPRTHTLHTLAVVKRKKLHNPHAQDPLLTDALAPPSLALPAAPHAMSATPHAHAAPTLAPLSRPTSILDDDCRVSSPSLVTLAARSEVESARSQVGIVPEVSSKFIRVSLRARVGASTCMPAPITCTHTACACRHTCMRRPAMALRQRRRSARRRPRRRARPPLPRPRFVRTSSVSVCVRVCVRTPAYLIRQFWLAAAAARGCGRGRHCSCGSCARVCVSERGYH